MVWRVTAAAASPAGRVPAGATEEVGRHGHGHGRASGYVPLSLLYYALANENLVLQLAVASLAACFLKMPLTITTIVSKSRLMTTVRRLVPCVTSENLSSSLGYQDGQDNDFDGGGDW